MIYGSLMTDDLESLILDLIDWLGCSPRPYSEVLDAWPGRRVPTLPV